MVLRSARTSSLKHCHPYPKGLVIATKGGFTRPGPNKWKEDGRPEYLRQCIEMSLRRLKLECIDLYQLHRIDPKVPVAESLGVLKEFQDAGKIRHIGLSEVSPAQIDEAGKTVKIVSVQNQYNLSDRRHEKALQYCEKNGLGFIPWYPVAAGKLAQPGGRLDRAAKKHNASVVQLSLAWLLHHSPVMIPIPGTSSVTHLEENMAAAKVQLSDAEWKEIEECRVRLGGKHFQEWSVELQIPPLRSAPVGMTPLLGRVKERVVGLWFLRFGMTKGRAALPFRSVRWMKNRWSKRSEQRGTISSAEVLRLRAQALCHAIDM